MALAAFRLRRHQMPTTSSPSVGTAASAASRPKHAAAVCGGRRSRRMPKFRLLGFEAGQEVGCRTGTGRRWRCGPAARRGQAAPSRVSLAGGPARWHREVRRSDGAAGLGAQRTRGGRRRRTSRQTAAHSRWGSGRRRAKTMVPTPCRRGRGGRSGSRGRSTHARPDGWRRTGRPRLARGWCRGADAGRPPGRRGEARRATRWAGRGGPRRGRVCASGGGRPGGWWSRDM